MTCTWIHRASKEGETARPCGKEGHPFCPEHQFIAEVLAETESVTNELRGHHETALTHWREEIRRLRSLVAQADDLAPATFVKRVHEVLPGLHSTAMEATIYAYVTSRPKEE